MSFTTFIAAMILLWSGRRDPKIQNKQMMMQNYQKGPPILTHHCSQPLLLGLTAHLFLQSLFQKNISFCFFSESVPSLANCPVYCDCLWATSSKYRYTVTQEVYEISQIFLSKLRSLQKNNSEVGFHHSYQAV